MSLTYIIRGGPNRSIQHRDSASFIKINSIVSDLKSG